MRWMRMLVLPALLLVGIAASFTITPPAKLGSKAVVVVDKSTPAKIQDQAPPLASKPAEVLPAPDLPAPSLRDQAPVPPAAVPSPPASKPETAPPVVDPTPLKEKIDDGLKKLGDTFRNATAPTPSASPAGSSYDPWVVAGWIALGITAFVAVAGAITLVVFFLRYLLAILTAPLAAGGAGAGASRVNWVAVVAIIGLVLWFLAAYWPTQFDKIVAPLDRLVPGISGTLAWVAANALLALAILFAVIALFAALNRAFGQSLMAGAAAAILFLIVGGSLNFPWSWPSGSGTAVVTAHGNCDGKERAYTLTSSNSLINGGADCEMVDWGRDAAVIVSGSGNEKAFPAGPSGTFNFRAVSWKCAGVPTCHVAATFCPRKTPKWDAVRRICTSYRTASH